MSGLPPYGPGDLIEVDVDEDDRIWISMAEHFARPLRLSRSEALALYLRGTELLGTAGVPEAPALALGAGQAADVARTRDARGCRAGSRRPIRARPSRRSSRSVTRPESVGASASTTSRIRRGSGARGSSTRRQVFVALGTLVRRGVGRDDRRRSDCSASIASAQVEATGERFEPRGLEGAGRSLYTPTEDDVPVRLRLAPAARWIAEYYATTRRARAGPTGRWTSRCPRGRSGGSRRLLLRVGSDATVLEPPELTAQVTALARATLDRYGG